MSALGWVSTPTTNAELYPLGFSDCSQELQPIWGKLFVFHKARARTRATVYDGGERETLHVCVRRGRALCGLVLNHRKLPFS